MEYSCLMQEAKASLIKLIEKRINIPKIEDNPALNINKKPAEVSPDNETKKKVNKFSQQHGNKELVMPPAYQEHVSSNVFNEQEKFTEDGFRVVSSIPEDDSDVSDAFEESDLSEDEMENIKSKAVNNFNKKEKFTEDGFRVVLTIPEDDSDVSDAFDESDLSEDEETENGQPKASKLQTGLFNSVNKTNIKDGETSEDINNSNPSKKQDDNTVTTLSKKKKKRKKQQEVMSKDTSNGTPSKVQQHVHDKELVDVDIPASDNVASQQSKRKKKKKNKQPVVLSKEEEEIIKSKFPVKFHKAIEEFGLSWADLESSADRERRELSKLPQPKQIPNCNVYLKKCRVTGKVITMYDYSKKLSTACCEETAKLVPKTTPPNEEDIMETKQQLKTEHLQELRGIKRKLNTEVVSKMLDPREKDRQLLALVEKLGGPKVKKPFVNYKILQEQKRQEKQKNEADREKLKDLGMHDLLRKKKRKRRKRDPNSVAGFNSQGGRFRDGVRVVTKRDLENINGSKNA